MTPQEKANELVEKFSNYACWGRFDDPKQIIRRGNFTNTLNKK